jgi:hypothetical protein
MSSPRIVGADSLSPVNPALIQKAAAAMGQAPSFWGRYFTSVDTEGAGEYHHTVENGPLAAHGIRVLPIARQTNHVGLDYDRGYADGKRNAQDLVATFGPAYLVQQGAQFSMFLDVEGSGASRLSPSYYIGWCKGLASIPSGVEVIPCVYGIPGDAITWTALKTALAAGATCGGVWLSHPYVEAWASTHEPVQWASRMLEPYPGIDGVDVANWQYRFAGLFDCNQLNPNLNDASGFLRTLPLPPMTGSP